MERDEQEPKDHQNWYMPRPKTKHVNGFEFEEFGDSPQSPMMSIHHDPLLSDGPSSSKRRRESGYESMASPATPGSLLGPQSPYASALPYPSPYNVVNSPGYPNSVSPSIPPASNGGHFSETEDEDDDFNADSMMMSPMMSATTQPSSHSMLNVLDTAIRWSHQEDGEDAYQNDDFDKLAYEIGVGDYGDLSTLDALSDLGTPFKDDNVGDLESSVDFNGVAELDPVNGDGVNELIQHELPERPEYLQDVPVTYSAVQDAYGPTLPSGVILTSGAGGLELPSDFNGVVAEMDAKVVSNVNDLSALDEIIQQDLPGHFIWDGHLVKYSAVKDAYGSIPPPGVILTEPDIQKRLVWAAEVLLFDMFSKDEILKQSISGRQTKKMDHTKLLAIIRIVGLIKSCWKRRTSAETLVEGLTSSSCETPLTDPLSADEVKRVKGAVFSSHRNQLKQRDRKEKVNWKTNNAREKQLCPIKLKIQNWPEEISISREVWAQAFFEHRISKAGKILFLVLFSDYEIKNCTLSGQGATSVLHEQKRNALCEIVHWMKNKSRNPYDFPTTILGNEATMLTSAEQEQFKTDIFINFRSQENRKRRR